MPERCRAGAPMSIPRRPIQETRATDMNYSFNFAVLLPHWEQFAQGCWLTLRLSATAVAIGLAIGLLAVLGKRAAAPPLRWLAESYIEVVRNTPFLVQVLFIFFGLPS